MVTSFKGHLTRQHHLHIVKRSPSDTEETDVKNSMVPLGW